MRQVPGNHSTSCDGRVATHFPPCFHPLGLPVRCWSRRRAAAGSDAIKIVRANLDALERDPVQLGRDAFVRPHAERR